MGGLANTEYKDFIDEFSDIDIGIFLNVNRKNIPNWLQPFSFYIPVEKQNGEEIIMEINMLKILSTILKDWNFNMITENRYIN